MANSASARKSARQAAKRRLINASLRSAYRTAVKSVRKAVAQGNAQDARTAFSAASSSSGEVARRLEKVLSGLHCEPPLLESWFSPAPENCASHSHPGSKPWVGFRNS